MQIRPFQPDDLNTIMQIERTLFGPEFAQCRMSFRQNYDLYGNLFQVVQCGDHVVGYMLVGLSPNGTDSWIFHIAVAPDYQQQGLGVALLKNGFQVAFSKGASNMWLTVDPANQIAVDLYQRMGFEIITREENYFRLGLKRLKMRKRLLA